MSAPERIWIDAWGGNWSPVSGGTQGIEYVRRDLCPTPPVIDPKVTALVEALREAARQHRIIAGMDLMGASATAWNAARDAEAAIAAWEA